jgi:hypothetical protein
LPAIDAVFDVSSLASPGNPNRPPADLMCETPDQTWRSMGFTAHAYEAADPGGTPTW